MTVPGIYFLTGLLTELGQQGFLNRNSYSEVNYSGLPINCKRLEIQYMLFCPKKLTRKIEIG